LIGMGEYTQAMNQLQSLQSETKDTFLLAQANLYKARLYKDLGQYYSAKLAYEYTLQHSPQPQVEYEYLEVLLKLNKDLDAQALLENISEQSPVYAKSNVLWATYLLDSSRYQEFDLLMQDTESLSALPQMELLRIRKAISLEDFSGASEILASTENKGDYYDYYQALILAHEGDDSEADFLFSRLVKDSEPELKVLSFLERLKSVYRTQPLSAIRQLGDFVDNPQNQVARAEQLYTMGYFAFQQQDFAEALKYLGQGRAESTNRAQMAEMDILIARSWLLAKDHPRALQSFNRYLNLYPRAKARDTALYYLGYLYFEGKDYSLATKAFNQLIQEHPASGFVPSARFYLAEMDYFLANYNLALSAFQKILKAEPQNSYAALRVAQTYYYLGSYGDAENSLAALTPSYDSMILQGHINFNRKDYARALKYFSQAEQAATNELRITEAKSYRALCLYQMKRYDEATEIYLQLHQGNQSPDTYLYLGGKSAYAAGDYHLALELFEQFVDTFPDSQYFLPVLADIANSYYNMGNYQQALSDYRNILLRFRNVNQIDAADRALLSEVFTGIELTLHRLDDPVLAHGVAQLADTFQSQYIRFELSYLVLRIYAEGEQWSEVLNSAEKLREDFPEQSRMEVELLMGHSLLKLAAYAEADSILSTLYDDTQDLRALLGWAEVDLELGDHEAALGKYQTALELEPGPVLWHEALKASVAADYLKFEELWASGAEYADQLPQARLLRLSQLVEQARFEQAEAFADSIINQSPNTHDHATAFYYKALILYEGAQYEAAISDFKKTMILFPDYEDITGLCAYRVILSYIALDARKEAEMHLWDYSSLLSDAQLEKINESMGESE
ncbi:MAG: tetratricopeptide repeat protein, partial [Candidatus Cloacimonetes bacterium]|nr:tetratricopeptide repeat protein [Candidatus Cloacimonadota bacterium]